MNPIAEDCPSQIQNSVLIVEKDGTVLYSNEANETLLHEWNVVVGEKLPSFIGNVVQRVIFRNSPEKMDIKVGNRVYLVVFSPLPENECINISAFDKTDQRERKDKIRANEDKYRQIVTATEDSNITERKREEKALFQSEENYRLLYETMIQGVVYQDANGKIISMNPAAERILGKTSSEFLGSSSVGEEYHTIREDGSGFPGLEHPSMVSLQTGQKVKDVVMGVYNPRENGYLWINISAVPLFRSGEDKPFQVYTLFEDITERKQSEEALRKSEERFRKVFENAATGIAIGDMDGRVINSNPALEHMLGYSSAELSGKPFYEFTHPDDVMNEKLLIEGLLSGHRDHYDIEKRYIRKDGQVINVQFKGGFIGDEEGKPIAGIALIEDITERRRAEEALKKAHENLEEKVKERTVELEQAYNSLKESEKSLADAQRIAHIGSWEWNLLNDKISWSDEMYRIFGLKPQEDLSFDKIINCIHPDDRDYLRDAHQEALKGEKPSILIEVRTVFSDEEKRIIHGCSEVIFNEENKPVQMIGTVQDITELKKAEETLRASEARYRFLYENSVEGILLTKPYCTVLSANSQACSLFGMTEDEIIKAGRENLVVQDEKLAVALEDRDRTGRLKAELTFRRKDGHTFFGEASSGLFVDSDGSTKSSLLIKDITERKQAEERIRELANIVESSNDAIITKSLDGIITSWNKGAEQIYGYSAEEILGKNISILEPEDLKGEIKQLADKVKKGERIRHYETLRLKKDGTKINVSVALSPVFDIHGKLTAISVIARDIIRRKKAEQALKLSEERYRIVAEQTGQLVYDYDVEKNDVCWAGNIKEFTGYDPEKFRNMTLSRESRVNPEDLDKLQNKIKKYMKYGGNYLSEYRLRKSNGSYIFVEDNGVCLKNEKGNVNRVIGTIKDITERKLSQERLEISERKYRSFIENFKGIVYQADENYIPQFLHGAVEEITGYSEEEFMAKRPWKEIIDPEYLPIIHNDELKLRASTDIRTLEREFRIKNRKGNTKWIHETFQKIPGENEKTIYQGVLYDITERKQAEEVLAKYEIAKKKEIHHRIKNNLQIISALLDLQAEKLKGRPSVSTSELLNAFKECQDRVISMALIHEELYKGGETDKLNFSSYVRKLAENLILAYTVGNKDISLDTDLEENTFFNVDTAVPLGIIVNEIVSNSFKYAFSGRDKGEIRIKLHREKEGECKKEGCKTKSYVLSVSDNGVGIPEYLDIENLDSLGLQLVTSLVDQLNGQLEIKRSNGTEFTVKFKVIDKDN